jgi:hypothetical protein
MIACVEVNPNAYDRALREHSNTEIDKRYQ